ncbi:MAG: membrane protein insertase YidC [Proteobacteria bacterium]|nr:membrane protein insertase YidC [Pseudomonadota bacterium]
MIDQRNLILAIVVSVAILIGFQFFFDSTREADITGPTQTAEQTRPRSEVARPTVPGDEQTAPIQRQAVAVNGVAETREEGLIQSPRITIDTPSLRGSIALRGGRIDDLTLHRYTETIEDGSPDVTLLSPAGADPYMAGFGWLANEIVPLPDVDTLWQADGSTLTPESPVTLSWDNGAGLRFVRTIAVDNDYMFTITQRVENNGATSVTLFPFGWIRRFGEPDTTRFFILHEGAIGVFNSEKKQVGYDDMRDDADRRTPELIQTSTGGWIGYTDKYWMAALVPDQEREVRASFNYSPDRDMYQVDYLWNDDLIVQPGGAVEVTNRLFAGAKEVATFERYRDSLGVVRFDLATDWGWLPFLTKPIFLALRAISGVLEDRGLAQSFGVAILILTVGVKLAFFPLANRSYRAMSKMKLLAPEMKKIKERFKDDRQRQQQEMMALYKREKANPVSGCLPLLLQIPVFFALYNVLLVTIEMRHAPFFGWVKDLSSADPLNIFNLFGALPFDPPAILPALGLWPILMGLSMWLQQRLNPQPTDKMQARIFMMLPIVFTFILASFPAGLVIYWTWNNILSVAQQWVIMKRAGVKNPAST